MTDDTAYETREFVVRDLQAVGRPYQYLEGRAVPYGTWADLGDFMEQHRHGSFKRSTDRNKNLPLLLFHDNGEFGIGHAERWEHRDDGMHGIWRLNDSARAQEAARMAEAGDLLGLSVGFQGVQSAWDPDFDPYDPTDKPRVTRIESRLVEVSMTTTPAFADAEVTMVRTRERPPVPRERDVDRWRTVVDGLRSGI